jgi:hypothetical protein
VSGNYRLEGRTPVAVDDVCEWAAWFETADRQVARDLTAGGAEVSTVFLGLDHSWTGPPPILFETMVFGGPLSDDQDRYATWDEAVAGHASMLAKVAAAESGAALELGL